MMAKKQFFLFDDERIRATIFYNHLAQLGKALDAEPEKAAQKLVQLMEVNGITGKDTSSNNDAWKQFYTLFRKLSYGVELDKDEQAVWSVFAAPENFDFPLTAFDVNRWTFLNMLALKADGEMQRKARLGQKSEMGVTGDMAGLFVNAMPRPQLRRTVTELEISPNEFGLAGSESEFKTIMRILRGSNLFNVREVHEDPSIEESMRTGEIEGFVDFLAKITGMVARIKDDPEKDIKDTLHTVLSMNSELSRELITAMRSVKTEDISSSRTLAIGLLEQRKARGASVKTVISPQTVYNTLYEADTDAQIVDPILYAWLEKLRLDQAEKDKGSDKTFTLVEAWNAAAKSPSKRFVSAAKQKRMRAILGAIYEHNMPIFTLDDAMSAANIVKADREKVENFVLMLLSAASEAKITQGMLQQSTTGKTRPVGIHKKLLRAFKLADDALIVLPDAKADEVLDAPPSAPPVAPPAPPAVPPAPPKELGIPETKAEAAHLVNLALLQIYGGEKGLAEQRAQNAKAVERAEALLKGALDNQKHPFQPEGPKIPNLPHMYLMWAAKPETRAMNFVDMHEAFQDFWRVPLAQRTVYSATIPQQFSWAAIAAMRNSNALFASQADFLRQHAAQRADKQTKIAAGTAPNMEVLIDVLENRDIYTNPAELNKLGRHRRADVIAKLKETQAWLDSTGSAASTFFGGSHDGKRFLRALRKAAATPATPK